MFFSKLLKKLKTKTATSPGKRQRDPPLVGGSKPAKAFQTRPTEELIEGADPSWLAKLARTARKAAILKAKETKTDDVHKQVYEMTTNPIDGETAKGWADGP